MNWRARWGTALMLMSAWPSMLEAYSGSLQPDTPRRAILDAIRPRAVSRVHQPVRIVVHTLTHGDGWAVVQGELVGATNTPIDWTLAPECEPELDKILFAVLRQQQSTWDIVQLNVCATEPPYWEDTFVHTTAAPCAVFAGLTTATGSDVRMLCEKRTHKPLRKMTDDSAALRRAGALLWEMNERHNEFGYRRRARGITPAATQKMTDALADRITKHRNALERLLPTLSQDTRFAIGVARFLQRWPDRDAIRTDLLLPPSTGALGADIASLAMQVHDSRRTWKTLFPFFRP
jgi:hypothetical protein